jgi:hypothetical protein
MIQKKDVNATGENLDTSTKVYTNRSEAPTPPKPVYTAE